MMINAFQTMTGLSQDASAGFVAVLIVMLLVAAYALGTAAILYSLPDSWSVPFEQRSQKQSGRTSGHPPAEQYVVPSTGHPDCDGKFCELRGCAIIGTCQAPRP